MAEGQQVGRVFVRVSPDTERFRSELKRELEMATEGMSVEVEVNADTAGARAEIAALKSEMSGLRSRSLNMNISGNAHEQLSRMNEQTKELNTNLAGTASQLRAVSTTASSASSSFKQTNNEVNNVGRNGRGMSGVLRGLVGGLVGFGKASFTLLSEGGQVAMKTLFNVGEGVAGGMAKVFSNFGASAGQALTSVVSALFMLAGAAAIVIPLISALIGGLIFIIGGVAAGIGGLPVLLGGLLIPILAVVTGMDGIKRAAAPIVTAFDAIKERVSNTFERVLTPVFQRVADVLLPAISDGMDLVATKLGSFADNLVRVVTSEEGLQNIRNAFDGVGQMLDRMTPGMQTFLDGILDVLGTEELWTILGDTIGGVLKQVGDWFSEISESGLLTETLENVRTILDSLVALFFRLLTAAMKFFNGATPGVKTFLDGVSDLVDMIDWEWLGRMFGDVFGALGRWLSDIDQGTIDAIMESLQGMVDAIVEFIDSGGLDVLIAGFTALVDMGTEIIGFFTELGEAFQDTVGFAKDVGNAIGDLFNGNDAVGFLGKDRWLPKLIEAAKAIEKPPPINLGKWSSIAVLFRGVAGSIVSNFKDPFSGVNDFVDYLFRGAVGSGVGAVKSGVPIMARAGAQFSQALPLAIAMAMAAAKAVTQAGIDKVRGNLVGSGLPEAAGAIGSGIGNNLSNNVAMTIGRAKDVTAVEMAKVKTAMAAAAAAEQAKLTGQGIGNNLTSNIGMTIGRAKEVTAIEMAKIKTAMAMAGAEGQAGAVGSGIGNNLSDNIAMTIGRAKEITLMEMNAIKERMVGAGAEGQAGAVGSGIGNAMTGNIIRTLGEAREATARGMTEIEFALHQKNLPAQGSQVGAGIGNAMSGAMGGGMAQAREATARGMTMVEQALRGSGAEGSASAVGSGIANGLTGSLSSGMNRAIAVMHAKMAELSRVGAGVFQVHSPSKVMQRLGGFIMEGLQLGIQDGTPDVLKSFTGASRKVNAIATEMGADVNVSGAVSHQHDQLAETIDGAISKWGVQIDRRGMAKMTNKTNNQNDRRNR